MVVRDGSGNRGTSRQPFNMWSQSRVKPWTCSSLTKRELQRFPLPYCRGSESGRAKTHFHVVHPIPSARSLTASPGSLNLRFARQSLTAVLSSPQFSGIESKLREPVARTSKFFRLGDGGIILEPSLAKILRTAAPTGRCKVMKAKRGFRSHYLSSSSPRYFLAALTNRRGISTLFSPG
jgi:hypothetical protein